MADSIKARIEAAEKELAAAKAELESVECLPVTDFGIKLTEEQAEILEEDKWDVAQYGSFFTGDVQHVVLMNYKQIPGIELYAEFFLGYLNEDLGTKYKLSDIQWIEEVIWR